MNWLTKYFKFNEGDKERWRKDVTATAVGSLVVVFVVAAAATLLTVRSGGEARSLLDSLLSTTRFLSNAVISSSATILALMVTMLSLSQQTKDKLSNITLQRINQLAKVTTFTLILSILFLSLHNLPLKQAENVTGDFLIAAYYVAVGMGAIISGLLVAIVLLLFFTIRDLIHSVAPDIGKDD